jgi:hypothetical protein
MKSDPEKLARHNARASKNSNVRYHAMDANRKKLRNKQSNLSKYGLTLESARKLLEAQRNLCQICKVSIVFSEDEKSTACVDHDNDVGLKAVRGILCSPCNTAIGSLRHSILILESAVEYLKSNLLTIKVK